MLAFEAAQVAGAHQQHAEGVVLLQQKFDALVELLPVPGAGNVVTTTDVLGNVTTRSYDAVGRMITTIDPLGNRTTTLYDVADQVAATVDIFGKHGSRTWAKMGTYKIDRQLLSE